jgi:anaphase-promoting complex subunit 2
MDDHQDSAEETKKAEMQLYWTYIVGMLTNLGALPLDRIHMMLSMFVQAPQKYDCKPEHLSAFLEQKIREDLLEASGGMYKLKQ